MQIQQQTKTSLLKSDKYFNLIRFPSIRTCACLNLLIKQVSTQAFGFSVIVDFQGRCSLRHALCSMCVPLPSKATFVCRSRLQVGSSLTLGIRRGVHFENQIEQSANSPSVAPLRDNNVCFSRLGANGRHARRQTKNELRRRNNGGSRLAPLEIRGKREKTVLPANGETATAAGGGTAIRGRFGVGGRDYACSGGDENGRAILPGREGRASAASRSGPHSFINRGPNGTYYNLVKRSPFIILQF